MNVKQLISALILVSTISVSAAPKQKSKPIDDTTEFVQIILYGQSLGLGWECKRAITTTPVDGNYMVGNNVIMNYNNDSSILNPLVATRWKSGAEQPVVSCVNAFSEAYRKAVNPDQKFIGMIGGQGGQTIERLSKECTNEGFYTSTFERILDNTLTAIDGKTVSCPAILFMQGEYNSGTNAAKKKGMTPGTNGTLDKDVYKELLLKLKNNMQADIMSKYNQSEKPLFFVYQTSGKYINAKEMPVIMAQIEFANENDDVILMNPHYAMPDYNHGHLSTNGYRWYGEYMAKALTEVLINEKAYATLEPKSFKVKGDKIKIRYEVPVPPLAFDTLTLPMEPNFGFCVYEDDSLMKIANVEIVNATTVEISCDTDLKGKVEIVYAGSTTHGSGNLRDSDTALSMYTYFDDSADSKKESYTPVLLNSSYYGKPYGLQNWSDQFYHVIQAADTDL